jgi:glycosyltransferase involved in cell wall biosynthesis
MPLIRSLKKSGYQVIIITQFDGYEDYILNEVDFVYPLSISRKGINPIIEIFTIIDLIKKLYKVKPDLLLMFTIKPVIYGSLAARLLSIPCITTITGLGTAFVSSSFWIKKIVELLYRISLAKNSVVFFQNKDDFRLFKQKKLVTKEVCKLVPGSGVDLERFAMENLPKSSNFTFLLVGRMLRDKGVVEFVKAAKYIKSLYPRVTFQLLGPLGVENRSAISSSEMNHWESQKIVEYLGQTDDVVEYIKHSNCVVLPSYREGTSRVLLEAAAMGRPIIASDIAGCKEIVDDGINGYLCLSKDYRDLANKMEKMLNLSDTQIIDMATKGRLKAENEFDQKIVIDIYLKSVTKLT